MTIAADLFPFATRRLHTPRPIRGCLRGGQIFAHERTDLNFSKLGRPNSEDSSFNDFEKSGTL